MQELEAEDVAERFRIHVNNGGGVSAFAKRHKCAASYVQRMMSGSVPLNELACKCLGLEKHRLLIHYYTRKE